MIRKRPNKKLHCYFCQNKKTPNYQEFDILAKFISDRSKIMPRLRSGVCAKHQRLLAKAVKRARHLALLPFVA